MTKSQIIQASIILGMVIFGIVWANFERRGLWFTEELPALVFFALPLSGLIMWGIIEASKDTT